MIDLKQILRALHAFVVINRLDDAGVDYIERLSIAAQICNDDDTWYLFDKFWDNDQLCKAYLKNIESA